MLRPVLLFGLAALFVGCDRGTRDEFAEDATAAGTAMAPPEGDSPEASLDPKNEFGDLAAAPGFTLPGLNGAFDLGTHAGEIVVVSFWAPWNALSVEGLAPLDSLYTELRDDGVAAVGVMEDEGGLGTLQAWADSSATPTFPLVVDTSGTVASLYGNVELLPTTVIVDREGFIRTQHTGILDRDGLLDLLGPVLIEDDEPLARLPEPTGEIFLLAPDVVLDLVADGAMLIDLRPEHELLSKGTLPYAQHYPLDRLTSSDLPANFGVPLIFVCDADLSDAEAAAEQAMAWGYGAVYLVEGGVPAWEAAGLPLMDLLPESDAPPVARARTVIG